MTTNYKEIDEALATLRRAGYAVSIWSDEDIRSTITDVTENTTGEYLDEEQIQKIVDKVKLSREWESLEEADEWDWEKIYYAVEEAMELD